LILDDSLSAVDTSTEEQILYHLNMNTNDSSTILIAHRLSTLQNADHIIVLDEGKIIQSGNHEQLVTKNGLYKDLYEKQQLEDILSKEV
jgi:ATP-binding cassette subfamily B protein